MIVRCLLCGRECVRKPCELRRNHGRAFCCHEHAVEAIRRRLIPGGRPARSTTIKAARLRAWSKFPPGPCERCGRPGQRHHADGNPLNNHPGNIKMLCVRCHMLADGRLERLRARAGRAGKARAANAVRDARGRFAEDLAGIVLEVPACRGRAQKGTRQRELFD